MRTGGAWAIAPRRRRDVVGSKISSEVASRSKSREFHPPERWRSRRFSIRISVCKFQSVERSMHDRDDRNRPLLCTLPNESIAAQTASHAVAPRRDLKHKEKRMGFFSKDIKIMDDLFVHTLRDIYYAEKQIVQSLPEMIEKASDSAAQAQFRDASEREQKSRDARGTGLPAARQKSRAWWIVPPSTASSTRLKT